MTRRIGRVLALTVALVAGSANAFGGAPIDLDAIARDVIAATARGDAVAIARAATARVPDPFLVIGELRRATLEATGPESDAAMAAIDAFSAAAANGPCGPGLARLRDRWRRATDAERTAELSRSRLRDTVRATGKSGRAADVLAVIDAARTELTDRSDYWVLRIRGLEAMSLTSLGRSPLDETTWREVAVGALAIGWRELAGRAYTESAMLASERMDDTVAAVDRGLAADSYEAAGDTGSAAGIRVTLARSLGKLGRIEDATAALALAERSADALDPDAKAHALWARAVIERATGHKSEAAVLLERAVETFVALGDRETASHALAELSRALREEGRSADAFAALERAVSLATGTGTNAAIGRALAHSEYSTLLLTLRRLAEALTHADAGLVAAIESNRTHLIRVARADRANVLSELGRLDEALEEQTALRAAWIAAGNARGAAAARLNESSTLWRLKRHAEAEAAAVEARDEAIAAGDRRLEATARSGHGLVVYSRGDLPAALEIQRGAVAAFDALNDRSRPAASANRILARLLERSGSFVESLDAARKTLSLQRSLAEGLVEADGAGARADARVTCDLGVFTSLELLRKFPARAPLAAIAAFEFAEAGRALSLAQGLANPSTLLAAALPPDVAKADVESRRTLALARQHFESSLGRSPDDPDARAAAGALERAWAHRDDVVTRVQRAAHRASSFVSPPPPDLEALKASLAPDTAVVLYHLGLEAGAAVVVRATGVDLVDLGPIDELKRAADAWLRVASAPGGDDEKLGLLLADRVVAPLRARIEGVTHLVISPDDLLAFVPFEALPLREGDAVRRLIEWFDVTYVPSASVWNALRLERMTASAAILAIGNPATTGAVAGAEPGSRRGTGLAALPGGEEEAKAVALYAPVEARSLLLGSAATLSAVTTALDAPKAAFRAIHFACHAIVDPTRPRGTGLVLAGGELLDVDRIARSRWSADLVVVAACESARGTVSRGEGVLGIPRALFLAGVPRAIVSQWVVSDRATAPFMKRFYDEAFGKGLATAAALRAAKLSALRAGGAAAHPSAWAPFVLWGRGD